MSTSVLFVCTYWGVRSQIAALLAEKQKPQGVSVASAGFEAGVIGGLPREVMASRGLELPSTSPPTLFNFARSGKTFDYVVTLCNRHTQESYKTLYDVVEMLFESKSDIIHWNIADFIAIEGEVEARRAAAEDIVQSIEDHVVELLARVAPCSD